MDAQQTADQGAEAAGEMARVFATFYAKLVDGKMDEHTASQLTLMYGRQVMGSPQPQQ